MTKRILAIVLALVLSLSVLSVEAFAAIDSGTVTGSQSGSTISLSWTAPEGGADYYEVSVSIGNTKIVTNSRVKTTTYGPVNVSASGSYDLVVNAYKNNAAAPVAIYTGTVNVFIEQTSTSGGITVTSATASSVTVSWSKQPGVTSYHVVYNDGTNHYIDVADVTSATINVAYSNLRSVTVSAGDNSSYGTAFGSWTNSGVTSPVPSTPTTGSVVLVNGILSWNATGAGVTYIVYANNTRVTETTATSLNVSNYLTYGVTFYVYAGQVATPFLVGTASYTGSSSGLGTVGSVYASNGNIYWTGNGSTYYTIYMYSGNGYGLITSATYNAVGNYYGSQSAEVASWVSRYASGYSTVYFTVTGSNGASIGSTDYNVYYGSGGYNNGLGTGLGSTNGLRATVNSNGVVTVTWNTVSGANYYYVYGSNGGSTISTITGTPVYSFNWTYGNTASISITAGTSVSNGVSIGTVNIAANGAVTYGTVGGNLGSVGTAVGTGNGNYVNGNNCSLTVGSTTTSVYWNGVADAVQYIVQYTNNDTNQSFNNPSYSGTAATINLGRDNCTSFTVNIIAITRNNTNGQIIGSATYTGSKTSTATKSEYDNLTLTLSGSSTIVSWNAVSGARGYVLYFTRIGGQAADEYFTSTNSYTLSGVGTRLGYELRVLAILSDGRNQHVGSAIHVAGDAYPSAGSTTTTPAQTTSVYVTNFKGTASQTTVSLSWSAASGNPTYELWYKKASASTWKKLGTTSKKAATVSKLSANTAYEFKIIANGRESGILKLSTTSSGTNTATAADPVEAGTASNLPVITSTAGSTGSFTVNWNPVKDADTYQVWVHQEGVDVTADGKQTYRRKATVTGTNATISGLSAGTYRVRIKASKDGGKTYTGLTDCAYVTVTVK